MPQAVEHVGFFCAQFSQQPLATGVASRRGKTDVAKGRIKKAAGLLTRNDKLRAEGKGDQAIGDMKQVAERAVDKVKQTVKKGRECSCNSVRTGTGSV